jgi:uncharacterized protein (DUF433 family)
MTLTPLFETHLYRDERGAVCVDTPRNKVKVLVSMIRACGGIDETAAIYPHLTRAQLHAAMAYYYDHQEEVDEAIRRDEEVERAARAATPESPLAARVREAIRRP